MSLPRISIVSRVLRAVRFFLVLIGLLWTIVTVTPITTWLATSLAGPWREPTGEVWIVLGAEGPNDGYMGLVSYWRAVYAARAWQAQEFHTVVVTGGYGSAETMAQFLKFNGVPADRIVVENRSTSTRENALFTAPIVAGLPGRKVLFTSDFHVYRSVRTFRKAGVAVDARFFPYALKRTNYYLERWPLFIELCTEVAKIGLYRSRGWM